MLGFVCLFVCIFFFWGGVAGLSYIQGDFCYAFLFTIIVNRQPYMCVVVWESLGSTFLGVAHESSSSSSSIRV
jgi:hypothetical protein